jgi:hypothetical protein
MAQAQALLTTYKDIDKASAVKDLNRYGSRIRNAVDTIDGHGVKVGRMFNEIATSGVAVAAANTIDSGKRDFTEDDARGTALSAVYVKWDIDRRRVSDWRKLARQHDELSAANIDPSQFKEQTFKSVVDGTTAEDFTAVVASALAAAAKDKKNKSNKVTAKDFKEAAVAAGIANPSKGGGKKPAVTVTVDTLTAAINDANNAIAAAIEAGHKANKAQRGQLDTLIARATELRG